MKNRCDRWIVYLITLVLLSTLTQAVGLDAADGSPLAAIIAIPLVTCLFLLGVAATLGVKHNAIKIFFMLLGLFMPIVAIQIGMEVIGVAYTGVNALIELLAFIVTWYAYLYVVVLMYYLIQFIIWVITYIARNKQENEEVHY